MLTQWILALMLSIQPAITTPWSASFPATADAIARAAVAEPLFAGESGPARTAALLVSVGWFESRFRVDAVGDHGHSHGLFQASRVPIADIDEQTRQALGMMRTSFRVCAGRQTADWLSWYASGGATCTNVGGLIASRHRVGLAMRLWKEHVLLQINIKCHFVLQYLFYIKVIFQIFLKQNSMTLMMSHFILLLVVIKNMIMGGNIVKFVIKG